MSSIISPSSRSRATTVVLSFSRWTSFSGESSTSSIAFDVRPLTRMRLPSPSSDEVVEESRRHQHRYVPQS